MMRKIKEKQFPKKLPARNAREFVMSITKRILETYGYWPLNKFVCPDCFEDYAIKKFIRESAENVKCDYCGSEIKGQKFSVSIDEVIKFIREGVLFEWGDPSDEGLPYESAEGGWQVSEVFTTYELLTEQIDELLNIEDKLIKDIISGLGEQEWCQKEPYRLAEHEELIFDWKEFCNLVKHKIRYVFYKLPKAKAIFEWERGHREPYEILEELGAIVDRFDLIKRKLAGQEFYRARIHEKGTILNSPSELGPPPSDKAIYSNRMSPAGIPMFYGSFDQTTAAKETPPQKNNPSKIMTIGKFQSIKKIKVLDLTKLPPVPSLFDKDNREARGKLIFLHSFSHDLSKPIEKDGREHIDYVPTQIVTEYFRHIFKDHEGDRVKGIYYRSSKNKLGISTVLFFENDEVEGVDVREKLISREKWLKLVNVIPNLNVPI